MSSGGLALLGACSARGGEADGKDAGEKALHMSRNAFIEVTPPPGQRVKWISEDDFSIVGHRRAETGKVTVRARPGWKLTKPKDGVMESAPGQMMFYAVAGDMGEDGGDGDGHECDDTETVVTNRISPVIVLTNVIATAGAILVPPETESVTCAVAAEVLVVSNGIEKVITTVTPCTICAEPNANVTTNDTIITPSEFHWEWSFPGDTGKKWNGGAAFTAVKEMTKPGRYSVGVTAVATNLPPWCACSAYEKADLLVLQIMSKAVKEWPGDPRRKKLGVGEFVNLVLEPCRSCLYRESTALEYPSTQYVGLTQKGAVTISKFGHTVTRKANQ